MNNVELVIKQELLPDPPAGDYRDPEDPSDPIEEEEEEEEEEEAKTRTNGGKSNNSPSHSVTSNSSLSNHGKLF